MRENPYSVLVSEERQTLLKIKTTSYSRFRKPIYARLNLRETF